MRIGWLAALLAMGTSLGALAQAGTRDELVGIWHACAEVGAGYCERWVLAPDGRFEARASQSGCPRTMLRAGRWELAGSTLIVTETSRTTWAGGRCEESEAGAEWVGGRERTRTHPEPRVERVPVRACSADEQDQSPAECRRFGATARWRLATDEPMAASRP